MLDVPHSLIFFFMLPVALSSGRAVGISFYCACQCQAMFLFLIQGNV